MTNRQQDWLVKYLLNDTEYVECSEELDKQVSGMTAEEIIRVMEKVSTIKKNLNLTSLGRELS